MQARSLYCWNPREAVTSVGLPKWIIQKGSGNKDAGKSVMGL